MNNEGSSDSASGTIRQGEVQLLPVDELLEDLFDVITPGPELVLFRDEATDHAHIV